MAIDFNTEPYNDDFDEDKKFYRILYRPSFAVQARELTQMQTILQNQISRHGDHMFKQGAMVIPGQASVETITDQNDGVDFVKLASIYNGVAIETFLSDLDELEIEGTSGVKAKIVLTQSAENADPTTIYVRYQNSGTDGETKTFADGEVITTSDGTYSFQAAASNSTGKGSTATVQRGVYYVNGFFVLVPKQTIVLDKYNNTPSYRVGLNVEESVITPESDSSLLDNAQNSFNFAAPGAHRYFIDLKLSKRDIDSEEDDDFIELIRVTNGTVKTIVETTDYRLFADELARRTFDESGNYTVNGWGIDVRQHRNNDRGAWTSATTFSRGDIVTNNGNTYVAQNDGTSVSTAPVHTSGTAFDGPGATGIEWQYNETPQYNRGVYENGDSNKLAIGIEPGKAYVQGYEVENVSTAFIEVNKAQTFEQVTNGQVDSTVGNYILITDVNNLPPVEVFGTIKLYDQIPASDGTVAGNEVGTARVRYMEWHDGQPFGDDSVYKLGLFDIQLVGTTNFARDVKGVGYDRSDVNLNFTAQIEPITTRLVGNVTASGTTVTGAGTSFETDLLEGDYVLLGTALRRVTAINSQTEIEVDSSVTVTGVTIDVVQTQIFEPQNNSLVFPLFNYAIRSVRQSNGTNDTSYTVYQKFTQTATGTNLSLSTSGTFASSAETDNYIVVDNDALAGGNIVNPVSITPSGSTVQITLPSAQSGHSMTVIAAVNRVGGSFEKTKTLFTAPAMTLTTKADATAVNLFLEHPDVYRLLSVKMDTGSFASPTGSYDIDITERYEMDDGQRPGFYDLGRLMLKPSFPAPTAPIQIVYEYFEHGNGDYFTVNSYTNINYDEIPPKLRDSIDYRPAVSYKSDQFPSGFDQSSASITAIPKRGLDIETDWSYYLPRKDYVALDFNGKVFPVTGVATLNPQLPESPALGMILYEIEYEPFTFTTNDISVNVVKRENKRYTMRDIGKLEKRINNLEYYTSLSMLETETQSLSIQDDVGLDRFKNGFIVDNFQGNNVGNSISDDYHCSIDMELGELRPFCNIDNVNLIEKNSNNTQRAGSNYELHGDIITLPIIEEPILINQNYASRTENINPFAIFTFLGNVSINPPSDDWFEMKRLPDIIQQVEGNYNMMQQTLEAEGVLGTVWGSWTQTWVGQTRPTGTETFTAANPHWGNGVWANARALRQGATQISYGEMLQRFGGGANGGRPARQVTVQTFATEVGQSRQGMKTTLAVKTDYQEVADRVVSTSIIPYIRSRNILIQARGLKPNTRFYGFFDGVDITSYCTPTSKMTFTAGSGTFDIKSNAGGNATAVERRIGGDSQVCLNRGDVIEGATSGATAVVVDLVTDAENNTKTLELANIIGTFQSGETITGSISNATGTVGAVTTPTNLVTNGNGDLNLLFNIPNTDALRFRTGEREFQLIDSADVNTWTSRGRTTYRAQGVIESKQKTINAVRNAEVVKERVSDTRTIFNTSDRVVSDTGWYDPLAQSFLVEQKGGAFVTEIDIFFATKDTAIPVTLEMREMVNGTPGKNVLPFSRVTLKPEDVNISNNTVVLNDKDTAKYDTPTTFRFETPVYLQDRGEYCFVLQSDSNNYNVWISNVGDNIPGTTRTISEQPYNGVMFKSQNASTWTPDQNQDIKFVMRRAKFDTSVIGNVEFVNDVIPQDTLANNPFQTAVGEDVVRVYQRNHGMYVNSRVTISGVSAAVNGIPAVNFNKTHLISAMDKDSYTIVPAVGVNATTTGFGGGAGIKATKNINYDVINPTLQMQTFSDTTTSFGIKTTSGKSVDGNENPYAVDSTFTSALVKEDNEFFTPRVIASEVNETNSMAGAKSLTFSCTMTTENDSVSPVIDTARASVITISNEINQPTESNINIAELDIVEAFSHSDGTFALNADGTITSTDSDVRDAMLSVGIGRYCTISGATTASNDKTFLIKDFTDDGVTGTLTTDTTFTAENSVSGTTLDLKQAFRDEITPIASSSISKYVTNPVKLENLSTFTRIKFAANCPYQANVDVYYRAGTGDKEVLTDRPYIKIDPDSTFRKVENGSYAYFDVDYSLEDMIPFDIIEIKLVMNSTNSSAVPKVKDLRVICCA